MKHPRMTVKITKEGVTGPKGKDMPKGSIHDIPFDTMPNWLKGKATQLDGIAAAKSKPANVPAEEPTGTPAERGK